MSRRTAASMVFKAPVRVDAADSSIQAMRPDAPPAPHPFCPSPRVSTATPRSSRDGARTLYIRAANAHGRYDEDICVMNADCSDIVKITNTPDTIENGPSFASFGEFSMKERSCLVLRSSSRSPASVLNVGGFVGRRDARER